MIGKTIAEVSLAGGVTTLIFTDGSQAISDGVMISLIDPIEVDAPKWEPKETFTCRENHFKDGDDYYRENGTCSYCGSLNPDQFMDLVEKQQIKIGPTDKNYKAYVDPVGDGLPLPSVKFHYYHLSDDQKRRFIELYNEKKLVMDFPGRFYVPPFFMSFSGSK
jgi:hypothetical protein